MLTRASAVSALVALFGCGDNLADRSAGSRCGDGLVTGDEVCDDGVNDALGGGCLPGCVARDDSDALFDRELLEVDLELPADDWDALRHERQTRHAAYGRADCLASPVASPYTWYEASVAIDGERLDRVGLRKKGMIGSQSTLVPSLKLRLDELVAGQNDHGLTRLALNNSRSDPSYARTCLAYRIFAAAGVPAPRCTFARVSVNGEALGVYVAVEEAGVPFLARRLPDASGTLYEGTASDFRPDFVGSFEQETNRTTDPDRDDLAGVVEVVDGVPDEELIAALEPLVDLDAFFRTWAVESLVWHRDGYAGNANNFFVYADPSSGGRLRLIPWGPDTALQIETSPVLPDSVLAFGVLANRLYAVPAGRDRYQQELTGLLDQIWRPDQLMGEVERIEAVTAPLLSEDQAARQATAIADLGDFLAGRRDAIEAATADGPPPWTSGLRALPCRIPLGPVSGSFTTTWDSLAADIFEAGSGELELSLDGAPVVVDQVGSRAGLSVLGGRLQLAAVVAGDRQLFVTVDFPDERWFESIMAVGDYDLVSPPFTMVMNELDTSTVPATVLRRFDIGEGRWTFQAVGTSPGAEVRGTFAATLFAVP